MTAFSITEDFPRNQIEFDVRFSNEQACIEYLFTMKWPDGFCCIECGHSQYWLSSKNLYICRRCGHEHSLTAGTIMHGTKKPLLYWFKAMWWFTTRKNGVNAVNLKELLGFGSYGTAWIWLQKLRTCTIRKGREKLSGTVEIDEFFLGSFSPGKRGRSKNVKTIVLAAVEKQGQGPVGRIRLELAPSSSSKTLMSFIKKNVEPGSTVVTDGWSGYFPLRNKPYQYQRVVRPSRSDRTTLPGVHLITSLFKRVLYGTFQGRFNQLYLQRYLDEYVFRFNRRNSKSIGKKFMRIMQQVASSSKLTAKRLIVKERADFSLAH